MGGSKTKSTSQTNTEPWIGQQPYLKDIYSQAQQLYGYSKPIYSTQETPGFWAATPGTAAADRTMETGGGIVKVNARDKNGDLITNNIGQPINPNNLKWIPGTSTQVQTGTEWVPGTADLKYFPEETVAGFTPEQIQGQELVTNRALSGSTLDKAGKSYMEDVIGGKYVTPDSNPYLKYYVDKAYENVLPQLDTTAIQAGRYGSNAWGGQKSNAMADINSQIYGGAYNTERGYQQQAAEMAPEMAQTDYLDYDRLLSVGAEKQALEQAKIDAAKEKWDFEQMAPWQKLAMYANLISGDQGGQTTAYVNGGGK